MAVAAYAPYLFNVFQRRTELIRRVDALIETKHLQFECFVGSGVSGTMAASMLALHFNKQLLIVRKPAEPHHSRSRVEGFLGGPYLIVDDLIDTATTVYRILTVIDAEHNTAGLLAPCVNGIILYYSRGYDCATWHGINV